MGVVTVKGSGEIRRIGSRTSGLSDEVCWPSGGGVSLQRRKQNEFIFVLTFY